MKALLRRVLFRALANPIVLKRWIWSLRAESKLTILGFHRVAPPDGSAYAPLEPRIFDQIMMFCRKNFDIISFADLESYQLSARPPMIISFDDGYKDFVQYAMPILARHKVRCNLNIIPTCVESGKPPFNVVLQDFVGKAPARALAQLEVPGFGHPNPRQERRSIGLALSGFVKRKSKVEQEFLRKILLPQMETVEEFTPTQMMHREDVLAAADHHEIGAHSYEHATLSAESDDYASEDAKACRRYFREVLKRETRIYALPNGEYRASQLDRIQSEGFEHILLGGDMPTELNTSRKTRIAMYGDSRFELLWRAARLRPGELNSGRSVRN